ncbi:class I SAM-dependent methyltransferase [Flaviramulus sp. BrNp1-15]|uniref:class I SAM-dependent methyltransferase n=1 Tax=Flaviramulus sp. BrNp1-15 TaxID=2916754 RepID=UPI001EE97FE2|nr:class I SAM-dependent methyltransferase [Flaviramulus sp. BrNp1-15]ULC58285.1 class I SAM-dependent methyltransferase [Flaviramulus sp. BrNp1-15]
MKNLNAELYANELLELWAKKNHLLIAEDKLLSKYLVDKTKKVLDVGTGGGRLAFYLEKKGFVNISAFDIVPKMIDHATRVAKETNSKIDFKVADAVNIPEYGSDEFDYALYLQQVLNFIPNDQGFKASLKESYRITKKGGLAIFAFLDYDSRFFNRPFSATLNILRKIREENVSMQRLPWIKINNKINWNLFNRDQALSYWVKKDAILADLKNIGYTILEVKNANQFVNTKTKSRKGMLYVVCKK